MMNLELVVIMLAVGNVISIFAAHTAGRNSGYRQGYALGSKVARKNIPQTSGDATTQIDYREPHVFDPIHNNADECECGLMFDADIHEKKTVSNDTQVKQEAPERIWVDTSSWEVIDEAAIKADDVGYVRADLLVDYRRGGRATQQTIVRRLEASAEKGEMNG